MQADPEPSDEPDDEAVAPEPVAVETLPGAEVNPVEGTDACLIVTLPSGDEYRQALDRRQTLFGRDDHCHFNIDHPFVSREHCRIEHRGGVFYLIDLGSKNGTWRNDQRISSAQLKHGDVVRVGPIRVTFYDPA